MMSGKLRSGLAVIFIVAIIIMVNASIGYSAFESVELGARPLGMGSAFVAVADDANAIFWNPAGITQIKPRELSLSYMELYNLVSYSSLSYAQRIKGFSVGGGFVSSTDIDGVYREFELILTSAVNVLNGLNLGANVDYLSVSANTGDVRVGNGKGVSVDLGMQYCIFDDLLSFGAAVQDLLSYVYYTRESVMDFPGQEYSQVLDISYKVGADVNLGRYLPGMNDVIIAVDFSDGDIHLGAEYGFRNMLYVRGGYKSGNALTRSITMGLGLKVSALKFDYAFIGSEVGAQTSQFSVSFKW